MYALELESQIDQSHQTHLNFSLFSGNTTQSDDFKQSLPDNFWLRKNKESIKTYNQRVDAQGVFSDGLRSF